MPRVACWMSAVLVAGLALASAASAPRPFDEDQGRPLAVGKK